MDDLFKPFIAETQSFLNRLAQNNSRDWFIENKTEFDQRLKAPAMVLLDVLSDDVRDLCGLTPTVKLFRQNRDVRFSKNKAPYKTHLHMLWETARPGGGKAAWFFGIERDGVRAGGGVLGFDAPTLLSYRASVDHGPLGAALDAARKTFVFREPELKRVPAPFPADHPRGAFLRQKSLIGWRALDQGFEDLPRAITQVFKEFAPVQLGLLDLH